MTNHLTGAPPVTHSTQSWKHAFFLEQPLSSLLSPLSLAPLLSPLSSLCLSPLLSPLLRKRPYGGPFRLADLGPRLRELEIIPDLVQT